MVCPLHYYRQQVVIPVRYCLLLLTGLCFAFSAKAQYQYLLHQTFTQREVALATFNLEELRTQDSLTVFKKIGDIQKTAINGHDDDLLMEVKLMRAGYFYFRSYKFSGKRVLAILDSVEQEAKQKNMLWAEIKAENMQALYNFNELRNYELGFEHHQRVYNLIKGLSPQEFCQKQNCLYQIACEYYFFNDLEQAIFFDLQALNADPPQKLYPFYQRLTVMNTLGLCYQKMNKLDSAEYYFNKTIALARKEQKENWVGIASGNLGYNYFLRKDNAKAIPLLLKDVDLAVGYGDWGLASGSQMVLTNISLQNGAIAEAGERLRSARSYVSRSGQYQRFQDLYPLMSKYYSLTKQTVLAAKYLDSAILVKDSLNRRFSALQLLRASQKVDLERHHAEISNIKAQKTINILQRNILILVVICMIIATILLYNKQQRKVRMQQEQTLKAKEELENATKQLTDFARNIVEKNAMIQLLEKQSSGPDHETILKLQQSTILTDDDWNYFRNLFEKVYAGYLQRLKEKLPGLTPAETRFMALTRLGLSAKEMAAMLGIGTDAIRQYRTRLRKKLDIAEDQDFEQLAAQI